MLRQLIDMRGISGGLYLDAEARAYLRYFTPMMSDCIVPEMDYTRPQLAYKRH